jgi:transcriptional regulator with XRE-family HTH domain
MTGLTQAEFAGRLGFHKRTYVAWEQGYREMPGRALIGLKREFNVDPAWVLEGPTDAPRAYVGSLDPAILGRAFDLVRDGFDRSDLVPKPDERMELVAEAYRLLVETPQTAERLLNLAIKIGGKKRK